MQQTAFKQLVGAVRAVKENTEREAADIERFIREYPPLKMPPIRISCRGRDLGPMYMVTVQGRRAFDLTPSGETDRKLRALVARIQSRSSAQN